MQEKKLIETWFTDFANQMKDPYVEFVRSQYHVNFSNVSRHDIHLFAWVNVYNEHINMKFIIM